MTIDFEGVTWVDKSDPDFDAGTDPKLDAENLQRYETTITDLVAGLSSAQTDIDSLSSGLDAAEDDITTLQSQVNAAWISINNTLTYSSVDGHTSVMTAAVDLTGVVGVGMRVKLTQTTVKFFIVTAISYSGGTTTITMYGGTDYLLANAAITSPYYSMLKAPLGFPLDKTKWTEKLTDTSQRAQASPSAGTVYNLTSLSLDIPIGCWEVSWSCEPYLTTNSSTSSTHQLAAGLSTSTSSFSDAANKAQTMFSTANNAQWAKSMSRPPSSLSLATKTSYYLVVSWVNGPSNVSAVGIDGTLGSSVIRAVCAYL